MELRTLALRVLESPSIEEKLVEVRGLTDTAPGASRRVPELPARAEGLRLDRQRGSAPFPRLGELDDPVMRGRVLHFFANHELLAMELMAVALLRFVDAPAGWRLGLGHALLEEQAHMRLYLQRMEALGVRFGELPLSAFFWRCLAPVDTPMRFACGLSLCFEQANLDWCRHYGAALREVGDVETEALLERVYEEEIGHVALGLRWLRRWKEPQATDWEAFVSQLELPLSPARGKGKVFDLEGRRRAGFDEDFIGRMRTFSRSRGRQPWVYSFNPGAEVEAAGRTPGRAIQTLRRDLAALPHLLASRDDIVLAPAQRPAFLARLQDAGFPLPEFRPELPTDRPVAGFRPFAEPGEHLRRSGVLALRDDVVVCRSLDQLPDRPDLVVKSEFSSTGQGVRFGRDLPFARRCLEQDGLVLAEPLYELIFEFSALWSRGRFVGLSWPRTERGRWVGHDLGPPTGSRVIHRALAGAEAFARHLRVPPTCGVDIGVDATGELRVLELNARTTMGHYALAARKRAPWARSFRLVRLDELPEDAFCLTDPELATTWCAILEPR